MPIKTLQITPIINKLWSAFQTGLLEDGVTPFAVPVSGIVASDIQIGAVEVKDATTDTRVKVKSDGTDNALVVVQNNKTSTSNTPAIGTSAGTVVNANSTRKAWSIQNLGTNPLFVRLGASASSTVFHRVLKAGTANDDGLGGTWEDDTWQGVVSVAGTSPRYVVTELS